MLKWDLNDLNASDRWTIAQDGWTGQITYFCIAKMQKIPPSHNESK